MDVSVKPIIWGFLISLVLILAAYFMVHTYISLLFGLAIVQGIVQLVLFLHLGIESKPQWSLMIFLFMVLIMVVLLGGTMWIMHNLDYNLMGY